MRAAWRLSINGLAARRSRSALLVAAVAMATSLVVAVACALGSLAAGMEREVASRLGRADVRLKEVTGDRFDAAALDVVRALPEVALAAARSKGPLTLRNPATNAVATVVGQGVDPGAEAALVDDGVSAGRTIERDGEVSIDFALAESLGAKVGDKLDVVRFGEPMSLEVVGIAAPRQFAHLRKPEVSVTLRALEEITLERGRLAEIQIVLRAGEDPVEFAASLGLPESGLARNIVAEATERVTSGVASALEAQGLLMLVASTLAYIAASFIVLTGLTTNVRERQRELAILRCIGAGRATLAGAQALTGAILGALGAGLGIPLGIALAWLLTALFPERLPAGLVVPFGRLAWAAAGSVFAGVLGALWPAINAARVRPLEAMSSSAQPARARGIWLVGLVGVAGLAWQLVIVGVPSNAQVAFWGYLTTGLPAMFIGYFLIGTPLSVVVARVAGPLVARALRLPRAMVVGSVVATPYRHGFSAGGLMVGLAMMTSIWTNGSALLRDWLDSLDFPDAFVHGWFGLDDGAIERIRALPFAKDVCPVTLLKIDTTAFGIDGMGNPPTFFVAFDPEPFFRMTNLHWIAGDPVYARRRLDEGGAVLVAKEFLVGREGFGIGDTFRVRSGERDFDFEIVGAISSPGLDVVSFYFDIGKEYANQALSSVFGTRKDLERVFGSTTIHMAQVGVQGDISDKEVARQLREAVGNPAVIAGSGREIKEQITEIGRGSMRIASAVAIAAMLIGCFGVGNVVAAGIDARRFEFGVLRAVGAAPGMLARLIYADVLLTALTACVLGAAMGIQGSWAGIVMYQRLAGIEVNLNPPLGVVAAGCLGLIALVSLTVAPLVWKLTRLQPRELLGSTRG